MDEAPTAYVDVVGVDAVVPLGVHVLVEVEPVKQEHLPSVGAHRVVHPHSLLPRSRDGFLAYAPP